MGKRSDSDCKRGSVFPVSIIGENMNIRRLEKVTEENGFVASYIHAGGKIGVLVDVETDVINDAVKEMARNVAMPAAA